MTWISDFPGVPGSSPGERMRADWTAGTDPQAMLAALREAMGDRPSAAQSRALRDFSIRCARRLREAKGSPGQRAGAPERAHAAQLLRAAERMLAGTMTDADSRSVRGLSLPVARSATERLNDPARSRNSALLLAAFHTLDKEPLGAALQAAWVAEHYGASDEREAVVMRAEQGAWLHELFGADILEPPAPPSPAMGAWEETGRWVPGQVSRMRYMMRFRDVLVARDPWIAVPQNSCQYGFGDGEHPLPIGALYKLWNDWEAATGECPACGGDVVGYAMGGMSRTGGVIGCCLLCERELRRQVGGLAAVAAELRVVLDRTAYRVSAIRHHMAGPLSASGEQFDGAVEAVVASELLG